MQLLPWDKSFTEYQIHQNSNKKVENLVHNVLFNLIDIIFRIISFGFSGFANPKPVKQEVSCTVILPPMVSVLCNCICSICFKCWYSLSSHFVVRLWRRLIGFNTKMASKMNRLWNRAEIMINFWTSWFRQMAFPVLLEPQPTFKTSSPIKSFVRCGKFCPGELLECN